MNEASDHPELSHLECSIKTVDATRSPQAAVPVIPLMSKEVSKEEGERLISQMPKRSSQEALEMMERMLGRRMPLVEGGTLK